MQFEIRQLFCILLLPLHHISSTQSDYNLLVLCESKHWRPCILAAPPFLPPLANLNKKNYFFLNWILVFAYNYLFCDTNVWVAKKDTKHSSNTLLRLVSFFETQTLFYVGEKSPRCFWKFLVCPIFVSIYREWKYIYTFMYFNLIPQSKNSNSNYLLDQTTAFMFAI